MCGGAGCRGEAPDRDPAAARRQRAGGRPAQTGRAASGESPSSGGPVRIFTDASARDSASRDVFGELLGCSAGERNPTGPGHDVLGERGAARPVSPPGSVTSRGVAVDHRAAVVDGVLEDRPGQYQPVDMGHRDADRGLRHADQAAAGHRAVQEQGVPGHAVDGGDHHRIAVHHHPEVAVAPVARISRQVRAGRCCPARAGGDAWCAR